MKKKRLEFKNKLTEWINKKVSFILRKDINKQTWSNLLQFIKFGIVGLTNTIISYLIYVGSLLQLQNMSCPAKYDYLIAQILSFVLSVLWSFYWNNKLVFTKKEGQQRNVLYTLLKTYISYSFTGLFLNAILSILWVQVFNWSKFIAPILNLIFSVPINYFLNKFWAFKVKEE